MKLDRKIYIVIDANGECKGIFATEELADRACDYYGACCYETDKVLEQLPEEIMFFDKI